MKRRAWLAFSHVHGVVRPLASCDAWRGQRGYGMAPCTFHTLLRTHMSTGACGVMRCARGRMLIVRRLFVAALLLH